MSHMLTWAQDHPDLRKIELIVRSTNKSAIAMYRKFGFVEEGCFRARVHTLDGSFVDDLAMAWFRDAAVAAQQGVAKGGAAPRS